MKLVRAGAAVLGGRVRELGVDPVEACLREIDAWRARHPENETDGMTLAEAHFRERDSLAVAIAERDDCDMAEACIRARALLQRRGGQVDLFA